VPEVGGGVRLGVAVDEAVAVGMAGVFELVVVGVSVTVGVTGVAVLVLVAV